MLLDDVRALKELCWRNPKEVPFAEAMKNCPLSRADVEEAAARLDRFAAYFKVAFPETAPMNGIVESPLKPIPNMKSVLESDCGVTIPGDLWIKLDSHLPVSGSIKARGGVYEVLKTAEDIALKEGLITLESDYSLFATDKVRSVLSG